MTYLPANFELTLKMSLRIMDADSISVHRQENRRAACFPLGRDPQLSPEQSWQPIDTQKAMQEQVFLGINMGETEEITVECSPAGSLQLIDRFGGYDFLFVSFSPKNGLAGFFLWGRFFAIILPESSTVNMECSRGGEIPAFWSTGGFQQ